MNKTVLIVIIAVIVIAAVGLIAKSKKSEMAPTENTAMTKTETQTSPAAAQGVMVGGALMTPDKDIVDNAVNASNVTTLVAAVKAAGLVETLKGKGPFTVFAPTNDAFTALPAGTVDTLLKPESKPTLVKILTYHVVPGAYRVADLTDGQVLTSVQGETLKVTKSGSKTMINGVEIQTPDVISSNGVTHVIGSVLMPK